MMPCAKRVTTLPTQMMKYLGASITGTLVHYGILTILVVWFTLAPLWASTCGAIGGALVIYLFNYFVTFQSTRGHIGASTRFFLIAAIGTAVNGLVLDTALTQMNWPLSMAQVCATGCSFLSVLRFIGCGHFKEELCENGIVRPRRLEWL